MQNPDSVSIVTPDWVSDSLDCGNHIDEARYHPRLLLSKDSLSRLSTPDHLQEEGIGVPVHSPGAAPHTPHSSGRATPSGQRTPPTPTTPTSGGRLGLSDSSRTKEALARMVSNRIMSSGREKPTFDMASLIRPPPPEVAFPLPPPVSTPPARMPLASPKITPSSPRGMGSPRGQRSPRARAPRSPRGHLRNITNNAEGGRPPKSPRGGGRGRGSRGGAKVSFR